MYKIVTNKIRCKFCGDILESLSVHDFKQCRCGKCAIDGGTEYARRAFATDDPEDSYEDLSLYANENGELVKAADVNKEDIQAQPAEAPEENSSRIFPDVVSDPEVTEESKGDEPKKKPKCGRYNFETGETIKEYY